MRYQFLHTEIIGNIEYALLLDDGTGNVIRRPILTETDKIAPAQKSAISPAFSDHTNGTMSITSTSPVPTLHGIQLTDEPQESNTERQVEMPRAHSMVPPGMGGVFIEHDTPGAAVETRKTY